MLARFATLLLLLAAVSRAALVAGEVANADSGLLYLYRFCYDITAKDVSTSQLGFVNGIVEALEEKQNLFFYNSTAKSWPELASTPDLTCDQQADLAQYSLNFTQPDVQSRFRLQYAETLGPVFLYVVAGSCTKRVGLEFLLEFQNPGGFFRAQFSCEDQGLLEIYLIAVAVYGIGTIIHSIGVQRLRRMDSLHSVVKMLTASIYLALLSIVCNLFHLIVYAVDGSGVILLRWVADGTDAVSQLALLMLLFVLAKGWTVSHSVLEDKRSVVVVFSCYVTVYVILFIWEIAGLLAFSSTATIFESYPGIVLMVLRLLTCLLFIYWLRQTYRAESHPEKRRFYTWLGVLYSIWLAALPIIVFAYRSPMYNVKRVNVSAYLIMNALALAAMSALVWPRKTRWALDVSSSAAASAGRSGRAASAVADVPYDML